MNKKIKVFLLLFILIFALLSVSSVCFAAKDTRLYGRPGLSGKLLNDVKINNKINLKVATDGDEIKIGLRESNTTYTNKLLVFFPGQGQFDNIISPENFKFTNTNYDCDIAVVQAPSQPKNNPNLLLFDNSTNLQHVINILKNYLNNKNYTISIVGYSAGGVGAIALTSKIITDYKDNANLKNRIELVIIDGIPNKNKETNKTITDKILKSSIVKHLTIVSSGDTGNRIGNRTAEFINYVNNDYTTIPKYKSKYMQLDCQKLEQHKNYRKHENVVYLLYNDTRLAFSYSKA